MIKTARLLFACMAIFIALPLASFASPDKCFEASGKLAADAQTIRLLARKMDWEVGKAASLTASTIVEGKVKLYPKDAVEVCLRENGGALQIKAQSQSEDAGKAEWHKIPARLIRTKTKTRL